MAHWLSVCLALASLLHCVLALPPLRVQHNGYGTISSSLPDLYEASISELQEFMTNGTFTSVDLTNAYLARIAEVNPTLRAVLELNPLALQTAYTRDAERLLGVSRGPLHGIPVLVKDNIATLADEGNTTAGSFALLGSATGFEARVVAKLKARGAVLLGKTNMCEWALARGDIPMGWSAGMQRAGNLTTSPYFPGGGVCGSSGGSAVASAVGLAAATLGTQTGWSIVCPASRNNIVGIKPTLGLTSRHGVIPISSHFDSVGPLARSVRDAALVLQAIAGRDPDDPFTLAQPEEVPDYTERLSTDALNGVRIGVLRRGVTWDIGVGGRIKMREGWYGGVVGPFNRSVEVLRELGAEIVDPADLLNLDELVDGLDKKGIIAMHDFKADVEKYLRALASSPIRTFQEIIDFNNAHPELEIPDPARFGQDGLLAAVATDGQQNATYLAALSTLHTLAIENSFLPTLAKWNLSALVLPTEPAAGEFAADFEAPVVSVPMGFLPHQDGEMGAEPPYAGFAGQPLGLSFMGPKWSEGALLGYAYAYEQRTRVRAEKRPYEAAMPTSGIEDAWGWE